MEGSGTHNLLPKWGRLRKKPQPLSDLTQLYSKTANESIYYLKLEERREFKRALQGWKALNTEVLYELTLLEHNYPNTQSYTKDELSLRSGVQELYHKASAHLERVQRLYNEEERRRLSSSSYNGDYMDHDRYDSITSSATYPSKPLITHPHQYSGAKYSPTHMVRTLRDPKTLPIKHPSPSNYVPSHKSSSSVTKVNFSHSKPLGKQNNLLPTNSNESLRANNSYERKSAPRLGKQENNDIILIDLTSDTDPDTSNEKINIKNEEIKDFLEFDDVYDSYLDVNERDLERLKAFENLDGAERTLSNLSIESTPLVPEIKRSLHNDMSVPTTIKSAPVLNSNGHSRPNTARSSPKPSKMALSNTAATKSNPVLSSKAPPLPSRNRTPISNHSSSNESLPTKKVIKSKPVVKSSRPTVSQQKSQNNISNISAKKAIQSAANATSRKSPIPAGTSKQTSKQNAAKRTPQGSSRGKTSSSSSSSVNSTSKTGKNNQPVLNTKVIRKPDQKPSSSNNSKTTSSKSTDNDHIPTPSYPAPKLPKSSESINKETLSEPEKEKSTEKTKEMLEDEIIDSLVGVDKAAAKQIFSEIVVHGDEVRWDDIAGLESAKASLKEAVVYPFLRPDLFRGLREPVRGMLLFGPPGTGKTMLARAVATESHSTFFSISASSLTSKFLGESEKLVRALFAVAKKLSPSIIFVDEIDSIMGSRDNEGENESSRRIKNEFLIQWSSLSNAAAGNEKDTDDERVLLLAATNIPWSIDEAARRRFVRRQYIPLPERETRQVHLRRLLSHQKHTLSDEDFEQLLNLTDGYSGSDITSLAKDAAMGPLRELGEKLLDTPRDQIRSINLNDFRNSLNYIKPSVSQDGLKKHEEWAAQYGFFLGITV
ncbi:hypothetical protein Kpol_1070p24 [Vanderwaltozyma polyspora DSM 70294]|uniref:AAA+ ATPase domain-containing protein n=1 Tax=Vanderwaltozyma polyspora (strain ATCC 22028 / DSM 70294 / BCRC 21397 / CBS 2163 / NBRC 10782 / NRRL Y-8283 / UCD 57-17) TaxID=436907 RepID=A7TNM4_VANPO|nr:uncharacterized protein Kpol_1070p24 [Vanderwaltozyma polyspora DSM 70294]EDO16141.1 hypothetical protein Kpol_1070p24 [Vanderwaltozyma polyspora DSM 70294]